MVGASSDPPWISFGLLLGLLVLAALGDGAYRLLRRAGLPGRPPREEAMGLRVLLGLAVVPWAVVSLDLAGIPIGRLSLTLWGLALFTTGLAVEGRLRLRPLAGRAEAGCSAGGPEIPGANLLGSPAALILAGAAASLILFSLIHVGLIPVRVYDALVGYDLVGKIMAVEGKLRSSVFTNIHFNAQCVYGPFTSGNIGYWYIFYPPVPRLWIPLIYGGFLLVYWSRIRNWTGSPTAASLAAFLVFLPSSFAFQLTEAQTDTPCMVFTVLALFATVDLLRGRGGFLPLSLYLLASATARTENFVFGMACTAVLLLRRPTRSWKSVFPAAAPGAFFLFWNLFYVRGLIHYDPGAYIRPLAWDPARLAEIFRRAVQVAAEPAYFGEFPWLILLVPVLWWLGRWSRTAPRIFRWGPAPDFDATGAILLVSAVMFLFYMPFFYMWNEKLNPIWTMAYTYKRGFLRFIPGIVAAFVAAPGLLQGLRKCDGPRAGEEPGRGSPG